MEQCTLKDVNNCLNAYIYSYLETSGDQSSILYLNVVDFFNTSSNLTSVAAPDCCFPALVYNMCCSIGQAPALPTNIRLACKSLSENTLAYLSNP
jgi:hypothetical protein